MYEFHGASQDEAMVLKSISDRFVDTASFIWRTNNAQISTAYNYITARISEIRALQAVKDTQTVSVKRDALAKREAFFFMCLTHIHLQVFRRAVPVHSRVNATATAILDVHNMCLQVFTQQNISLDRENVKVLNDANLRFHPIDERSAQVYADSFVVAIPYPNVVSFIAKQPNMQLCRTIYNTEMPHFIPSRAATISYVPRYNVLCNLHTPPLPRLPELAKLARRKPAATPPATAPVKPQQVIVIDDDDDGDVGPASSSNSSSSRINEKDTAQHTSCMTSELKKASDALVVTMNVTNTLASVTTQSRDYITNHSIPHVAQNNIAHSILSFKRKLASEIYTSHKFAPSKNRTEPILNRSPRLAAVDEPSVSQSTIHNYPPTTPDVTGETHRSFTFPPVSSNTVHPLVTPLSCNNKSLAPVLVETTESTNEAVCVDETVMTVAPQPHDEHGARATPQPFAMLSVIAASFDEKPQHVVSTVAPDTPCSADTTLTYHQSSSRVVGTVCLDETTEVALSTVSYDVIDGFVFSSCAMKMMSLSKRRKTHKATYVAA
jgi:hypothetical protein